MIAAAVVAARMSPNLRAAAIGSRASLSAVGLNMLVDRVLGVSAGMEMVRVRNVSVMGRFLMVACFVMPGSLSVVVCSLRVMICSLRMMMGSFL
jgi:hypothetical protein